MEKQLSKIHGKLEQAVKKLAIQVEKTTDKLCDFYILKYIYYTMLNNKKNRTWKDCILKPSS